MNDPKTSEERAKVAGTCVAGLDLDMPALIDDMEDSTERAYCAWPDRLYLIDERGRIGWKSGLGPRGFKPLELENELRKLPEPAAKK